MTQLVRHSIHWVDRLGIGKKVRERRLALVADGLFKRDRRTSSLAHIEDLVQRQLGLFGDLLIRGLTTETQHQGALCTIDLLETLNDVHREADRATLIGECTRHCLSDPPRGVRRELEVAAPVELLDGTDQAENALLDEIEEAETLTTVVLRNRDNQAQVRFDHLLLGLHVALFDALGETNLVGLRQQGIATDLMKEQLQGIGCAFVGKPALKGRGLSRTIVVVDDLDTFGLDQTTDLEDHIGLIELNVLGKLLNDFREQQGTALVARFDQALELGELLNFIRLLNDHVIR